MPWEAHGQAGAPHFLPPGGPCEATKGWERPGAREIGQCLLTQWLSGRACDSYHGVSHTQAGGRGDLVLGQSGRGECGLKAHPGLLAKSPWTSSALHHARKETRVGPGVGSRWSTSRLHPFLRGSASWPLCFGLCFGHAELDLERLDTSGNRTPGFHPQSIPASTESPYGTSVPLRTLAYTRRERTDSRLFCLGTVRSDLVISHNDSSQTQSPPGKTVTWHLLCPVQAKACPCFCSSEVPSTQLTPLAQVGP